jgi:hypothetical protein
MTCGYGIFFSGRIEQRRECAQPIIVVCRRVLRVKYQDELHGEQLRV